MIKIALLLLGSWSFAAGETATQVQKPGWGFTSPAIQRVEKPLPPPSCLDGCDCESGGACKCPPGGCPNPHEEKPEVKPEPKLIEQPNWHTTKAGNKVWGIRRGNMIYPSPVYKPRTETK